MRLLLDSIKRLLSMFQDRFDGIVELNCHLHSFALQYLVSSGKDSLVFLWELSTGNKLLTFLRNTYLYYLKRAPPLLLASLFLFCVLLLFVFFFCFVFCLLCISRSLSYNAATKNEEVRRTKTKFNIRVLVLN